MTASSVGPADCKGIPEMSRKHVKAWYAYACGADVYAACGLAIFLPITLEQMARATGYIAPELNVPCAQAPADIETVCKARILGGWVDTASFSMYVKSIAVAMQALSIISVGPLADSPFWRRRLLVIAAYTGSISAMAFVLFPSTPYGWIPIVAAVLTIVGNAGYATSIVCANAFLPSLAREDPDVIAAGLAMDSIARNEEAEESTGRSSVDERQALLPHVLVPAITSLSTPDLAGNPHKDVRQDPTSHFTKSLSLTTSRLSSTGTAFGFFSGVGVLCLLTIPVSIGHGSIASLRVAIGISGSWWALLTIPAWIGLPGGDRKDGAQHERLCTGRLGWVGKAWKRVGNMVNPGEMKKLPNLFALLLAWVFLSDGFHTTTYTAILYTSSTLKLPSSKIILIGVLVQISAAISAICAPRVQLRLGYTNLKLMFYVVVLAQIIPVYACIGLLLPFGGLRTEGEMYVAATWFGLLYGPFNSYSRAVYAELVPPGHESSFFSLFSLTDKSSSMIGPFVVGLIADTTGNIRYGYIFLLIMLALPIPVLMRVQIERGKDEARIWAKERKATERRLEDV